MTLSLEIMKTYTSLYDNFEYANKLFNTAENNLELSSFENQIRKTFGFKGTPLKFIIRERGEEK